MVKSVRKLVLPVPGCDAMVTLSFRFVNRWLAGHSRCQPIAGLERALVARGAHQGVCGQQGKVSLPTALTDVQGGRELSVATRRF
jgi:hypothetical protein